jgi:hypothetical protein
MTGTINLDGDLAVVEDSGTWIIAQKSDVEQKSDGSWGLVDSASSLGEVSAETVVAAALSGDVTGGSQITNLAGANLAVNGGTLEATDTDTTDHAQLTNVQSDQHHPALSVSEDGSLVLAEPTDLSFGSDLDVVDESDGTVRVDFSGTDADTRTNISEDGTELVTDVTDIDFVGDVSVADDGDGSVTATFTDTNTDTDTRVDVTDGTTSVADPTEATFTATGAASISIVDNGDGTATVEVGATDTDTTDHSQLTNVQSGQHHTKTTSTDLESGGSDTLNVTGLAGDLADPQDPKTHDHAGQSISPQSIDTEELSVTESIGGSVWIFYLHGGKIKAMAGAQQRAGINGHPAGAVVYEGDRSVPSEVHRVLQSALSDIPTVTETSDGDSRGGVVSWMPGLYNVGFDSNAAHGSNGHVLVTPCNSESTNPGYSGYDTGNCEVVHRLSGWDTLVQLADGTDPGGDFFVVRPGSSGVTHHCGIRHGRFNTNAGNQATDPDTIIWDPDGVGNFRECWMDYVLAKGGRRNVDTRNVGNMTIFEGAYEGASGIGMLLDGSTEVWGSLAKNNGTENIRGGKLFGITSGLTGSNGVGVKSPTFTLGIQVQAASSHGIDLGGGNSYCHASKVYNNGGYGIRATRGGGQYIEAYNVSNNTNGPLVIEGAGDLPPMIKINGRPWKTNLSGETGVYDGQEMIDDGTNTANNGLLCHWDTAGAAWQPSDGSATFS